jgi:putative FmdB family regulatory protein
VPIYDYVCACGERFEALLASFSSPAPACARCGGSPARRPGAVALLGKAKLPPTADQAPSSWLGTHRGNTEYIARWRRALDARAKLEEDNPELAHRGSPVVAHEGRFHNAPAHRTRAVGRGGPPQRPSCTYTTHTEGLDNRDVVTPQSPMSR